jgi:hypothetical protein
MEIVLNRRLAPGHWKKIELVERESPTTADAEPDLQALLQDPSLSADVTAEAIEFLKALKFTRRRPTALYYLPGTAEPAGSPPFRRASTGQQGV